MRILILEADLFLHNDIEEFVVCLEDNGHEVDVVCCCYENIPQVVKYIDEDPDAIAFFTTLTKNTKEYQNIWNLCALLNIDRSPVQIWVMMHDQAYIIASHVPVKYRPCIEVYDCDYSAYCRGEQNQGEFLSLAHYPEY